MRDIARTGRLVLGPYTERFEAEFAAMVGTREAVAVSSGTAALEIVLRYLGVTGRRVLVPANAFIAMVVAIQRAGGIPVFVPIDVVSLSAHSAMWSLAGKDHEGLIVMVMHTAGLIDPTTMATAAALESLDIPMIEDASHAHGARTMNRLAGSLGVAGCFSLGATKILTSGGAGGIITTSHPRLAAFARAQRNHGGLSSDAVTWQPGEFGYGWLMSEASAAFGVIQLRRLPKMLSRRLEIADRYRMHLVHGGSRCQLPPDVGGAAWWKFPVTLASARAHAAIRDGLRDAQIDAGSLYWPSAFDLVHQEVVGGRTDEMRDILSRQIALPIHPGMTDEDVSTICDIVSSSIDLS